MMNSLTDPSNVSNPTPLEAFSESSGEASGEYEKRFGNSLTEINERLAYYLDSSLWQTDAHPQAQMDASGLWEAMRYGTLGSGKRIRSVLALEACNACGGELNAILPTACAIEMVHAQSLIHDDLPCMDDDDLRRGKLSVHKAFGESTAILAGDALIAMAFGLIAKQTPVAGRISAQHLIAVIGDFADVTSVKGLVNGQFVDIYYEGKPYTAEVIEYIHTYKTGALFRFALSAGARLAGAPESVVERFAQAGQKLGLIFQIVDDLLDIGGTSESLGKTAGKDIIQEKATYPALFGKDASAKQAEDLADDVIRLLSIRDGLPDTYHPEALCALVSFIFKRSR